MKGIPLAMIVVMGAGCSGADPSNGVPEGAVYIAALAAIEKAQSQPFVVSTEHTGSGGELGPAVIAHLESHGYEVRNDSLWPDFVEFSEVVQGDNGEYEVEVISYHSREGPTFDGYSDRTRYRIGCHGRRCSVAAVIDREHSDWIEVQPNDSTD